MTLSLTQNHTAVVANRGASFLAIGGTPAYAYTVLPGGAGGSIDSLTGIYASPAVASSDPKHAFDTIQVTDSLAAVATATILVGTPLILFCDILQQELGLANGRVYLWDQKIMQPKDSGLYIAVSVPSCRPFSNINRNIPGDSAEQITNVLARIEVDIISRGPEARDRKEEIVLAFNSIYAQQQQEANSFFIGKLPPNSQFLNLSAVDGAAIPYRYKISVNMLYAFTKTKAVPYFSQFSDTLYTNS